MDKKRHEGIRAAYLILDAEGPAVGSEMDARDLIEAAMNAGASTIVVPVERLAPSFLELRSRVAGEVIQKVMNYKMRFAVVGDVSAQVADSDALRDFMLECDRGTDIMFVPSLDALDARLEASAFTSNG